MSSKKHKGGLIKRKKQVKKLLKKEIANNRKKVLLHAVGVGKSKIAFEIVREEFLKACRKKTGVLKGIYDADRESYGFSDIRYDCDYELQKILDLLALSPFRERIQNIVAEILDPIVSVDESFQKEVLRLVPILFSRKDIDENREGIANSLLELLDREFIKYEFRDSDVLEYNFGTDILAGLLRIFKELCPRSNDIFETLIRYSRVEIKREVDVYIKEEFFEILLDISKDSPEKREQVINVLHQEFEKAVLFIRYEPAVLRFILKFYKLIRDNRLRAVIKERIHPLFTIWDLLEETIRKNDVDCESTYSKFIELSKHSPFRSEENLLCPINFLLFS